MQTDVKEEALRRLAIAEGHLKKVRNMVDGDEYCPDVIHQSRAVQSALKKVDQIILEGHLDCCVLRDMQVKGKKKDQLINELVDLFKKNGK